MIDFHKSALIHMLSLKTGNVDFIIQVYGANPKELMTIPNSIINSLARKYPNHTSSPFLVESRKPFWN